VFSALLWMDGRQKPLYAQKSLFLPKAAWLAREKPEVYEKTAAFIGCPEYLVFRLTGEKHAFCPSEEFSAYIWNQAGLAAYGLEGAKFPPALTTGREAGRVRRAAAGEFGIPEGVPVYAAGPDFLMALLGTAAVRPGLTCDRAGTSEGINACTRRPVSCALLRCLPHVIQGYWNAARLLPPTGRVFEWFRGASGQSSAAYDSTLQGICAASFSAAPGGKPPLWFFPVSAGAGDPGVFVRGGQTVSASAALRLYGKEEAGLAVLRALGFAVRRAVEDLREQGVVVEELRVSGGQARNILWNRLKAHLAGKPLLVPETPDAELTGCLAAGLYGRGEYASLDQAAESLVRFAARYAPSPEEEESAAQLYRAYIREEKKLPRAAMSNYRDTKNFTREGAEGE
jgi:xylulokinase